MILSFLLPTLVNSGIVSSIGLKKTSMGYLNNASPICFQKIMLNGTDFAFPKAIVSGYLHNYTNVTGMITVSLPFEWVTLLS